ncbi:MAG: beta strand repeat-containing protein, partial [Bacteroidota bacterium]
ATGTVLYAKAGNNQNVAAGNYGNLTLSSFRKVLASSGTIAIAGTFTPGTGNHTTTGSTIEFNGSGAQTIPAFNYNNLTVSGSNTKTAGAALEIPGNLVINGTFNAGAYSHRVSGNWINNGTFTHGGGTIQFDGTTIISGSSENTFNNVLITEALTAPNANMNVVGNWTVNDGTFTPGSSTVTFNNTQAPQSISGTASAFSFNNLTIANAGQTISLQGSPIARKSLNVAGNLTLNSGTFSTIFTDVNMTGGNWTNNGATFTSGGSKVIFNGTNGNQAINGTAATQTFARLEMNKPGRTLSLGGSTTRLNVTDTFALVAGTYDAGTTDSLKIGNNWVITGGSFTPGVSTVAFDGELAQVVPAQTYHKLSIIGSGAKSANGNLTVNDELNISSGKELDMDTYQLVDGGTLNTTGSGTLRTKNTGETPLPNGKTWSFAVAFEGAAEQTLSNGTYNGGVTINNSTN